MWLGYKKLPQVESSKKYLKLVMISHLIAHYFRLSLTQSMKNELTIFYQIGLQQCND